ncbi:MAG: GDSL-type esterase/lipase family protein [Bacteroidaceae bacterium]|nr:GDSL-type esterase/lipase family protein [Bacteroidaceae bacterium]
MKKALNCILVCCMVLFVSCKKDNVFNVSCIGDSVTFGWTLENPEEQSYPALLNSSLNMMIQITKAFSNEEATETGTEINVRNFGVCGTTLGHSCDMPYIKEQAYQDALASDPDLVIMMLGTNDSKPQNRIYKEEFKQDLDNLVASFRKLKSKPAIILMTPPHAFSQGWGINDSVLTADIRPIIQEYASENSIELIRLDSATQNHPEYFSDGIHPNLEGQMLISKCVMGSILVHANIQ